MAFRRRRFVSRRRTHRWMWVRDNKDYTSFTVPGYIDLMSDWRNKFGITINLPELTLWRFRLRLSITGTISVAGSPYAADSCFVSSYVASLTEAQALASNTDFYSQHFLIYDRMYSNAGYAESPNVAITTTTSQVLYREWDIKSHRRYEKLDDTHILEIETGGNFVITTLSYNLIALYKLPR